MADLAAQGRRLVQAAGSGPGDSVLRLDTDAGQGCSGMVVAQQAQVKEIGHRCGDCALRRC